MKAKLLNIALILSSLLGYLEWGTDRSMFLAQGEWEILQKLIGNPGSVLHPMVLLPLAGQLLLLSTLFQKQVGKIRTYIGLGAIAVLFIFILAIGVLGMNVKIALSTLPFLITATMIVRHHRKNR